MRYRQQGTAGFTITINPLGTSSLVGCCFAIFLVDSVFPCVGRFHVDLDQEQRDTVVELLHELIVRGVIDIVPNKE